MPKWSMGLSFSPLLPWLGEALTAEVMLRNLTLAEHLKKH